jgi:hypothetical protein
MPSFKTGAREAPLPCNIRLPLIANSGGLHSKRWQIFNLQLVLPGSAFCTIDSLANLAIGVFRAK